ncbi:kyphoscoliosis peptidase [Lingula anatina]|uniref:Kyphoscoliosis peptidase n=1 Tax=Lingula anatina TaxID=7574 RepID=A0A1S3HBY7_LINAN|nr:kyphoscoliosis peptidase [Lingula anatina]|eukprot:XP_013383528.1 kyphoscoliosis peptidase [Lingula anatina]
MGCGASKDPAITEKEIKTKDSQENGHVVSADIDITPGKKADDIEPVPPSCSKKQYLSSKNFDEIDNHAINTPSSETSSLQNLVNHLLRPCRSDLDRVRVFFRWITHNIRYDLENFLAGNPTSISSECEDVLRSRKASCDGYSNLFLQMCKLSGIQAKKIRGYSKGYGYIPGQSFQGKDSDHAWNAVFLENTWRLIDCTWGTGHVTQDKQFKFVLEDFWFLTDPEELIYSHFPLEATDSSCSPNAWQLTKTPRSLHEFEGTVSPQPEFFTMGLSPRKLSHQNGHLKFINDIEIKITSPKSLSFSGQLNDMQSGQNNDRYCLVHREQQKDSSVDLVVFQIIPPCPGVYLLTIHGFNTTESEQSGTSMGYRLLDYVIDCSSVENLPRAMPSSVLWGLLPLGTELGLSSEIGPKVSAENGQASLEFKATKPVDVYGRLTTADDRELPENLILKQQQGENLVFNTSLPEIGNFKFTLYGAKSTNSTNKEKVYFQIADYLIQCDNHAADPVVFPDINSSVFGPDCHLISPVTGKLPNNQDVEFKVYIPGVASVAVQSFGEDNNFVHTLLDQDGSTWSKMINTGTLGERVYLSVCHETGGTEYDVAIEFTVE